MGSGVDAFSETADHDDVLAWPGSMRAGAARRNPSGLALRNPRSDPGSLVEQAAYPRRCKATFGACFRSTSSRGPEQILGSGSDLAHDAA